MVRFLRWTSAPNCKNDNKRGRYVKSNLDKMGNSISRFNGSFGGA